MADKTIPFPGQALPPPAIQAMLGHVSSLLESANAFGRLNAGQPLGLALTAVDAILDHCEHSVPVAAANVPPELARLQTAAIEARKALRAALERSVLVVPGDLRINGKPLDNH